MTISRALSFAEQVAQLCADHGLTCLALNFSPAKPEIEAHWYAYAHGHDALGSSGDHPTAEGAIAAALSDLQARRGRVSVPALSGLELSA